MRTFHTQRQGRNEELCTQLEWVESDLVAAQKAIIDEGKLLKEAEEERQVAMTQACQVKEEREVVEAKCKEVEQEKDQLKKELEELWVASNARKKELEELWARFATKKKKLEEDYQKQVDDMFFFNYQCCMRKNNITQDIPNCLSDEENATVSGPAQGYKDLDVVGLSNEEYCIFAFFFYFPQLYPDMTL